MPDLDVLLIAGTAVLFGTAIQGSVGFGFGLVAAPVVTLLDPTLMPGSLLVVGVVLPALTLAVEHDRVDRRVGWAIVGRVVGTVPAVALVVVLSRDQLAIAIGIVILVLAALSVRSVMLRLSRSTLIGAGFFSAISGTISSAGGPPLGLVYQREQPATVRSTVALVLVVGSLISLAGLAVTGELTDREIVAGLTYVPFLFVGFGLAVRVRKHLHGPRFRRAILGVIVASAIGVLLDAMF